MLLEVVALGGRVAERSLRGCRARVGRLLECYKAPFLALGADFMDVCKFVPI